MALVTAFALLFGLTAVPAAAASNDDATTPLAIRPMAATQFVGYTAPGGPILRKKYRFSTERLGVIGNGSGRGICINYGLASPDGVWREGAMPGVTSAQRATASYIANKLRPEKTTSDHVAAVAKVSINLILSAEFRYDYGVTYKPWLNRYYPAVVPAVNAIMAEAARYAGPIAATPAFVTKPSAGGLGTATVRVTAKGLPYAAARVTPTIVGGVITKVTAKAGVWTISYKRTGVSGVRISGTVSTPNWQTVGFSTPSNTRKQHLVRSALKYQNVVSFTMAFDSKQSSGVVQNCTVNCAGQPPITVTGTGAAVLTRYTVTVNGITKMTFDAAANTRVSRTFVGNHNDKIVVSYQIKVGTGWSASRVSSSFVVDCPPVMAIPFNGMGACNTSAKVTFGPAINTTGAIQKVTIGDLPEKVVQVGDTLPATTVSLTCGFSVTVSVQNNAGGWTDHPIFKIG